MKKILSAALSIALLMSGCVASNLSFDPTNPNYAASIVSVDTDIKSYTQIAVTNYILIEKDANKRVQKLNTLNKIAREISAATDKNMDLASLRQYAIDLVTKNSSDEDKVATGILLNSVASLIENKININISIPDSQKTQLTKHFVKTASEAVVNTTSIFMK